MARIFKDINGESHNLDDLLRSGNISIAYDIDILTKEIVRYYIGAVNKDGMFEKDKVIEVTEEYYKALLKTRDEINEEIEHNSLIQSIMNYSEK